MDIGFPKDEALLLQSRVAQLEKPSKRIIEATRDIFQEGGCAVLEGEAEQYLEADDLVALKSSTHDPISKLLRKSWITRVNDVPILV